MTNQSQDIPLVGRVTKNLLGLSQERAEQLEYFAMTKEVFPAYDGANDPNFTEGEKWFRMVFGELSPAELRHYHAEISDFRHRALDKDRETNRPFGRAVLSGLDGHRREIWKKLAPSALPFPGWVARRILAFYPWWLEALLVGCMREAQRPRSPMLDFYSAHLTALLGKDVFSQAFGKARATFESALREEYAAAAASKVRTDTKSVQEVWKERRAAEERQRQLRGY